MTNREIFAAAATLGAVALILGCEGPKPVGREFPSEQSIRAPQRFLETQAAAGARADSTLSESHFDGEQLNSLGRQKLDLTLKGDHSLSPLTIYMDIPQTDATAEARRRAVVLFLKDRGLLESQVRFAGGANPESAWSTDPALRQRQRTEQGGEKPADGAPMKSPDTK